MLRLQSTEHYEGYSETFSVNFFNKFLCLLLLRLCATLHYCAKTLLGKRGFKLR